MHLSLRIPPFRQGPNNYSHTLEPLAALHTPGRDETDISIQAANLMPLSPKSSKLALGIENGHQGHPIVGAHNLDFSIYRVQDYSHLLSGKSALQDPNLLEI